ncbi:MAG: hypothetical protein LWW94_01335 [Candidatus Desulfofervidaceae bacterium]|nr:hypothetical protein [Candidatus Desulfofervidaceae bacterium]
MIRKLSIRQKIEYGLFIEAIIDVNISFLEMRKTEKNYFLYHDPKALTETYYKGENAQENYSY